MLYPVLAVINFLCMVGQFVINALSANGPDGTIFKNKTGDLSDLFYTEITPAGWAFSIWGFIYTWQALWVLYSLVNICRKGPNGAAYQDPMFLPLSLFIITCIVCFLNITWLITFDRQEIEAACGALLAYSLFMYAALFVSYRALDRASPKLIDQKRTLEIWLTRALVHNGLGIQATWVTIASVLNIAMVMTYSGSKSIGVETAATVALSILAGEILIFAVTDLFLLDRYTRYTLTPYLVVVFALSASLAKNYEEGARNSIFTIVLLVISACLLVVKLLVTLYRHFTRQRYTSQYEVTIANLALQSVLSTCVSMVVSQGRPVSDESVLQKIQRTQPGRNSAYFTKSVTYDLKSRLAELTATRLGVTDVLQSLKEFQAAFPGVIFNETLTVVKAFLDSDILAKERLYVYGLVGQENTNKYDVSVTAKMQNPLLSSVTISRRLS